MTGPSCARCGGPTRRNRGSALSTCEAGRRDRTCGHWWRRDDGCRDPVTRQPDDPNPAKHSCGWDHRLFWQPTVTDRFGDEHRYHAPGCHGHHSTVAIVRPRGGRKVGLIPVSAHVSMGSGAAKRPTPSDLAMARMRGWSLEELG